MPPVVTSFFDPGTGTVGRVVYEKAGAPAFSSGEYWCR